MNTALGWWLFAAYGTGALYLVARWWREHRAHRQVEPPVNVRLEWAGGHISVDTMYVGHRHGHHAWMVTTPIVLTSAQQATVSVVADHLPPRTLIIWRTPC